jgi:hypothetical protein
MELATQHPMNESNTLPMQLGRSYGEHKWKAGRELIKSGQKAVMIEKNYRWDDDNFELMLLSVDMACIVPFNEKHVEVTACVDGSNLETLYPGIMEDDTKTLDFIKYHPECWRTAYEMKK